MSVRESDDEGLGLIELVIATFILGFLAIAFLPALWNGIRYSSTQAQTATATRFLYSVVERGREEAPSVGGSSTWCANRSTAVATTPGTFTAAVQSCTSDADSVVTLVLTATSAGASPAQLATVTAKVYVP
jgi:Tfp pilus assembly protein PilE